MEKHKLNIFPEAKPEDYARLLDDIKTNGYDRAQPIVIYQGAILDGWNRQKACGECGVAPAYKQFYGSDAEAIAFVMRSNKRRNLNSGQWAMIAAEAEDIIKVIAEQVEKERRERQAQSQSKENLLSDKNLSDSPKPKGDHANKTATKVAEIFPTNRTYVNQARKIAETAPDIAEKVKAGKMTFQDAKREAARRPETDEWLADERARQEAVNRGETVVANFSRDKNLIQWAQQNGKLEAVNRGTKWGNPFLLDADGTRDEVCDNYTHYYLPHKPSLLKALPELKGKVLACHCYPERCHGDALADSIEE